MMEIGTPACSMSVRVVCRESCKVIRRSPAHLSRRPNSSEYHSGWTGVPAWSVITYSPAWYQSSPASPDRYAAPATALSSSWRLRKVASAATSSPSSGRVRLPLRDLGSSMRTWYSTSTRVWLTVSVLARRSMSDQRRPSTSPRTPAPGVAKQLRDALTVAGFSLPADIEDEDDPLEVGLLGPVLGHADLGRDHPGAQAAGARAAGAAVWQGGRAGGGGADPRGVLAGVAADGHRRVRAGRS